MLWSCKLYLGRPKIVKLVTSNGLVSCKYTHYPIFLIISYWTVVGNLLNYLRISRKKTISQEQKWRQNYVLYSSSAKEYIMQLKNS